MFKPLIYMIVVLPIHCDCILVKCFYYHCLQLIGLIFQVYLFISSMRETERQEETPTVSSHCNLPQPQLASITGTQMLAYMHREASRQKPRTFPYGSSCVTIWLSLDFLNLYFSVLLVPDNSPCFVFLNFLNCTL